MREALRISTTPAPPGAVLLAHTLVGAVNMAGACVVNLEVGRLVYDLRMPVSWGWFLLGLVLATAALHVLRDAWVGQPPQPLHLLVLTATVVVLWPLAIRFFRWS